ncbi:MFS transporter [uncultured Nitratireductor sp.]|uniref:spinster family MFS transporter n=1 Tax=uncultured Nitratireductor sp. TaxID=520953 RepID=UPI0025CDEF51|nr:MFS transporter [uncultured Nitratireductor sp.]
MRGKSNAYALGVLTAVFAVNQLDRNILAITLDQIGTEFALTDTQLGLLSGPVFVVVYVLFGFPVAALAARGNRRNIVSAATAIWSSLTIAMALAQNFAQLAMARLGVGIGEAGAVSPAHSMISDLYPPERRTSAMATFAAGANIGVLLAFLVGGIAGQAFGWRWAFVIAGLPGLLLALLLRFTVAEPQRTDKTTAVRRGSLFLITWRTIRNDRGLFHALCGLAVTGIVTFGALAWNAAFIMRAHGLSQSQTGIYLALGVGVLGGLGTWAGGAIADRLGADNPSWRLGVVIAAILIAKPFSIGFLLFPSAGPALACLAVSGSLAAVFWGPTYAFLHARVEPHMRPMATAIYMCAFNIVGVGVGPTVIGLASDMLFAGQGARSLAYAILLVQIAGVWGAWHYWRAMRTIAQVPEPAPQPA